MSRQAEAAPSTISAEQIARIWRAIDHALPNGGRWRVISLTEEELVLLGEMLDDAEARLVEDAQSRALANNSSELVTGGI